MPHRLEITTRPELFDAEGDGIRLKAHHYFGTPVEGVRVKSAEHFDTVHFHLVGTTEAAVAGCREGLSKLVVADVLVEVSDIKDQAPERRRTDTNRVVVTDFIGSREVFVTKDCS